MDGLHPQHVPDPTTINGGIGPAPWLPQALAAIDGLANLSASAAVSSACEQTQSLDDSNISPVQILCLLSFVLSAL
eukprot:SAG22_NODE_7845_length_703_cov_0.773179_1_plen_75_part_10